VTTSGRGASRVAAARRGVLVRGFVAFLVVAGVGQAAALLVWTIADTGASAAAFARIGWMYVGAFHHVAIELEVPDVELTAAGTGPEATSLSVGVALLTVTAVAAWLLYRAGRAAADRAGGRVARRVPRGAAVSIAYAAPILVISLLVDVATPLRLGGFASGELRVSLSAWQALVRPLAIAAAAGAAGGLRSALDAAAGEPAADRIGAAIAGGWRMVVVGLALSLGGLFVAGVVQPDGPAALLTPSTARYVRAVFDRPTPGILLLGHHVAVAPNEAVWTLVPAMGGCVSVRGSVQADLLCYRRFPTDVVAAPVPIPGGRLVLPIGGASFGAAPAPYLAFLLVPALASVLGGRRAGARRGTTGVDAIGLGAAAGVVFAALVAVVAALSSVTVAYGAAFAESATAGRVVLGPEVWSAALLALAWGVIGGAIGAATRGWIARLRARGEGRG
jgi:hypothetical protein